MREGEGVHKGFVFQGLGVCLGSGEEQSGKEQSGENSPGKEQSGKEKSGKEKFGKADGWEQG